MVNDLDRIILVVLYAYDRKGREINPKLYNIWSNRSKSE